MIEIDSIKGELLQLISMSGCFDIRTMLEYFDWDKVRRKNHLYNLTKRNYLRRKRIKGKTIYLLTNEGREYLLSYKEGFLNTAVYNVGQTTESRMEYMDEYTIERGIRTGELLMRFHKMGYTPYINEKPDYFDVMEENNDRGIRIWKELSEAREKRGRIRNIPLHTKLEYSPESYKSGVEMMCRLVQGKYPKDLEDQEPTRMQGKYFYTAREIKSHALSEGKEGIKGSRVIGLLLMKERGYLVYYPKDRKMRWEKTIELNVDHFVGNQLDQAKIFENRALNCLNNLFIVSNYDLVQEILVTQYGENLKADSFNELDSYFLRKEELPFILDEKARKEFSIRLLKDYGVKPTGKGRLEYQGRRCEIGVLFKLQGIRALPEESYIFCLKSQENLMKHFRLKPIIVDELCEEIKKKARF